MAHLYEIAAEYRDLLNDIESGEIPEEAIADTLEAVGGELDDKLENVACFIKALNADAAALAEEEAALKARKQAKQKKADRLVEYLTRAMEQTGRRKLERPRAVIALRATKAVEVANEAAFVEWAMAHNDSLLTFSKPTASKTAIKAAIEAGAEIPFAAIVERRKAGIK